MKVKIFHHDEGWTCQQFEDYINDWLRQNHFIDIISVDRTPRCYTILYK